MRYTSAFAAIVLLSSVACLPRGPVVDLGEKPPAVGGTIAGQVLAAGERTPLSARKVSAVDTASGARFEASTAINGGYTIKVPPGTYRLEVETRPDEIVVEQPEPTQVNPSDIDADRNFVLRPRPV
jgi:hypothetical protein